MSSASTHYLIARSVWIDFSRRKDFFVLASLLMLFVLGALTARVLGVENESTSQLLLSCGLGLASALSAVLVALFASRALPEEFEARTLYPLLAKPVRRSQMLWAKFLGIASLGALSLVVFCALAWLPVPKPASVNAVLLLQAVLLQVVALAGLCWLAFWLSLYMPSLVSALLSLIVWFLGAPVLDFAVNLASQQSEAALNLARHAAAIVPDWASMRLFQLYVEGAPPLNPVAFLALGGYGLAFTALFAALSVLSFERRSL